MLLPRRPRAAVIALVAMLSAVTTASADPQTAAPPPGCSGPANGTWLNVAASSLRNGNGQLAVTIYQDIPSKFLVSRGAIWVGRFDARCRNHFGLCSGAIAGRLCPRAVSRRECQPEVRPLRDRAARRRLWLYQQSRDFCRSAVIPIGAAQCSAQRADDADHDEISVRTRQSAALSRGAWLNLNDLV